MYPIPSSECHVFKDVCHWLLYFSAPRIDNPEPLNLLPQPSFLNPADLAQFSTRMLPFISLLELRSIISGHPSFAEQVNMLSQIVCFALSSLPLHHFELTRTRFRKLRGGS